MNKIFFISDSGSNFGEVFK